MARQEIDDLMRRDETGLAADVLGLLTAAGGPLAVEDLATLTVLTAPVRCPDASSIRRLLTVEAARSLQPVGPAGGNRYQFAHDSLLEYAQTDEDLTDPEFRRRIHQWAQTWRDDGWPAAVDGEEGTPRYLLDTYPATLAQDPQRLAALVSDVGWVDAAIQTVGVDRVLADLRRAAAAGPAHPAVGGDARGRRGPGPPPAALRRRWTSLATCCGSCACRRPSSARTVSPTTSGHGSRSQPGPGLVPLWTTRRASRALSVELGRHDGPVRAVAVLPDGRVVTGGDDGRVLVWDPAAPGGGPVELGRHDGRWRRWRCCRTGGWSPAATTGGCWCGTRPGRAAARSSSAATTAGWRRWRCCRTGGWSPAADDGRVLVWDPAAAGRRPGRARPPRRPGGGGGGAAGRAGGHRRATTGGCWCGTRPGRAPARLELGRHDGAVRAVAVLPDGRVVSGGDDGRVLVWDPARPGAGPVELGRHDGAVGAVAVLPDGRVVSGGGDGRVLVWDPAAAEARPGRARPPRRRGGGGGGAAGRAGGHRRGRRAGAGVGPGRPGGRPGRARPPRRRGDGGGGAAGRAGGHRRGRRAGAGVGPGRAGRRPGRARPPRRPGARRWRCCRTGGWSAAGRRAGAGVGPGRGRAAARSSSAATTARWRRWRCCRTGGWSPAGDDGRVLVWDPAAAGRRPGRARPPRRRGERRWRCCRTGGWSPAATTGGCWCGTRPRPGAGPVELGRHDGAVGAVAVLPDGRVVTGGRDGRVLVWDVTTRTEIAQLGCSVTALATGPLGPSESSLVVAHSWCRVLAMVGHRRPQEASGRPGLAGWLIGGYYLSAARSETRPATAM